MLISANDLMTRGKESPWSEVNLFDRDGSMLSIFVNMLSIKGYCWLEIACEQCAPLWEKK